MTWDRIALVSFAAIGWWLFAAHVAARSPFHVRAILWTLWLMAKWRGRVIRHCRTGEQMLVTHVSRVCVSSLGSVWKNRGNLKPKLLLREIFVPWEVQIMAFDDDDWDTARRCEMKVYAWAPVEPFWRRHFDPYEWCKRERKGES